MVLLVLIVLVVNKHGLMRLMKLQQEQRLLDAEVAALLERSARLREQRHRLENDMTYIERLAREKYRMVKRGEKVFRVIKDQNRNPESGPDRD
ncbi:MAG: septum formation initiator family protein [Candidatus Marinimicrobia bacterium]|nr:septum formation initiator family protein [Candidatus Neomarinimicrobiota bacterium]